MGLRKVILKALKPFSEISEKELQDDFDDGAYSESVIAYHVECPYFSGDKRAHCHESKEPDRFGICMACKDEWLSAEVDE